MEDLLSLWIIGSTEHDPDTRHRRSRGFVTADSRGVDEEVQVLRWLPGGSVQAEATTAEAGQDRLGHG